MFHVWNHFDGFDLELQRLSDGVLLITDVCFSNQ